MDEKALFIEAFRKRTKQVAIGCIRLVQVMPRTEEAKVLTRQLVRSASSCAANYRSACRARSQAEFYAKMSIAIEEADETLFWLELTEEAAICNDTELKTIQQEITVIIKVLSKARKITSNNQNK
ncbi:MAG: four helix bundle protein [Bacteroidetes bacterium]|nr:four helix bundle protein [Bacteroidota bacterium]